MRRTFQITELINILMKQITKFWSWFQDNEEAIKNALLLGINTKEVFHHFNRNYSYISKRIGFLIIIPSTDQGKFTIIFTAEGYRKPSTTTAVFHCTSIYQTNSGQNSLSNRKRQTLCFQKV